MIVKLRGVPPLIQALQALLPRLGNNHPKRFELQQQLDRRLAGLRGEESIDYYLDLLEKEQYHILHDLRLANGRHFFQLDTLLITSKFITILEIKNIAGKLTFDPQAEQLIRTIDNQETGFRDPISQTEFHLTQLEKWLKDKKCPALPLEALVVISGDRTIYTVANRDAKIYRKICHSHAIHNRLKKLQRVYNTDQASTKDIQRMCKVLIKHHQPLKINVCEKLAIKPIEIQTGVRCEKCAMIPMAYYRGSWRCPKCAHNSKNAHLQALKDYCLLVNPIITNSEFRRFLHIPTVDMANYQLQMLQLSHSGELKNRKYSLEQLIPTR